MSKLGIVKTIQISCILASVLAVSCSPAKMQYLNAKALLSLMSGALESEAPEHAESAKVQLVKRWLLKLLACFVTA